MPRVLLLTSHPLEGRDGADKELALALARGLEGYDPFWFGRAWPGVTPACATGRRIPMLSSGRQPGLTEKLQAAAWGVALARRVDLVHAVYSIGFLHPAHAAAQRHASWLRQRPVIHTVPSVVNLHALRVPTGLGTTVVLSEHTANLMRRSGVADLHVIPPGVDLARWSVAAKPGGHPPRLLYAGHYNGGAGGRNAIRVAAAIRSAGHNVSLTLAMRGRQGQRDGTEMRLLRRLAQRYGVHDVTIRGRVPDMQALIAESTIVLHVPYAQTGASDIPVTLLEAMASGRPAIVSELPSLERLGAAVSRVTPGDVAGARDAAIRLLVNAGWWDEMAGRAHDHVAEHFSADSMVRCYERLYDTVLDQAS